VIIGALLCWPYFGVGNLGKAMGFSLAITLGVLGFRKDFVPSSVMDCLPGPLKVVAGLQTVAGLVLLFLFGLALRNRFRMK
jgi:hypothetical protein